MALTSKTIGYTILVTLSCEAVAMDGANLVQYHGSMVPFGGKKTSSTVLGLG